MGLFNKKNKEEQAPPSLSELPKLPSLPNPNNQNTHSFDEPSKLPSLPSSSFGEKFSQNAIKEAVSGYPGKKEVEEEADDSKFEQRMMHEPPKTPRVKEEDERTIVKSNKKSEPIFIRIDKFEESLKILEEAEKKISEMENLFRDIRKIKEEEEIELSSWENNIQTIKKKIEKIDSEIFSKVE